MTKPYTIRGGKRANYARDGYVKTKMVYRNGERICTTDSKRHAHRIKKGLELLDELENNG